MLSMSKMEMPIGLMHELTKDKRAMQNYAALSEQERQRILTRAKKAESKEDMQLIVMSLSDKTSAVEYQ